MDTSSDRVGAALWHASHEIVGITWAEGGTRKCERQPVTGRQLALLRQGLEAQLQRALVYGGDQELIDLLRDQSDRLL
jgi:hypothetical protein